MAPCGLGRTGYLGTTEARPTYSDLVDAQGLGTLSAGTDFELLHGRKVPVQDLSPVLHRCDGAFGSTI